MKKILKYLKKMRTNRRCNAWAYIMPLFYISIGIYVGCSLGYAIGCRATDLARKNFLEDMLVGTNFAAFIHGVLVTLVGVIFSIKKPPEILKLRDVYEANWTTFSFKLKWLSRKIFPHPIIRTLCLIICIIIAMKSDNGKYFDFSTMIFTYSLIITGGITIIWSIFAGFCKLDYEEQNKLEEFIESDVDTLNEWG